MRTLLAVGTGSFLGGIFRYLLSLAIQSRFLSTFPFGTMGVNIIGCFLIGFFYGISEKGQMTNDWRLFLVTGLCGGFTTFSAFSNQTFVLLRDGQYGYAGAYVAASLVLGLAATIIGFAIIKFF